MTRTYAVLEISRAAYNEIRAKLANAGYSCAMTDQEIDMHGIAVAPDRTPPSLSRMRKIGNWLWSGNTRGNQ